MLASGVRNIENPNLTIYTPPLAVVGIFILFT